MGKKQTKQKNTIKSHLMIWTYTGRWKNNVAVGVKVWGEGTNLKRQKNHPIYPSGLKLQAATFQNDQKFWSSLESLLPGWDCGSSIAVPLISNSGLSCSWSVQFKLTSAQNSSSERKWIGELLKSLEFHQSDYIPFYQQLNFLTGRSSSVKNALSFSFRS